MAILPPYEPTPSLGETLLTANQQRNRWPMGYLPSYSSIDPSHWWKKEALEVLQTSHDFNDIKHILKFTPGLDPATAAFVLSSRCKGWLNAFLDVICQDDAVNKPCYDSLSSMAEAIVAIIRRRSSLSVPGWNGDWIVPALISSTNISIIAEKLYTQIHSIFCTFAFEDWVAWCHGFQNDAISTFLDNIFDIRNKLVQYARQYPAMTDRLLSLQQSLVSQQPLPHWIVSTVISFDTSSSPSEALKYFLYPIYQLFSEESSGILPIVRKLSVLCTRFELKVVHETDVNWPEPFSADFTFWESVQRDSPEYMAKSNTKFVSSLYFDVSTRDLLCHGEYMKDIGRLWSDLVDDIFACLIADGKLTNYFMEFAEELLLQRNLHSAAAVGLALSKYRFRPGKPSRLWDIINPEHNFAGSRKFMAENGCLPYIFPFLVDIRRSENSPKLVAALSVLGEYFGERKKVEVEQSAVGEKTGRAGTILDRYSLCYALRLHFSCSGVQQVQNNTNPRDHGDMTRPSCSLCKNTVDKAMNANRDQSFFKKELYSKPHWAKKFHIAFQQQYAIEIWALKVQKNYRIFMGALRQIRMMLLENVDALIIALEILSSLDRTQMVLLSCAAEVTIHDFSALENYSISIFWTEEKQADFSRKFTCSLPGSWDRRDILNSWDRLLKDLVDKIRLRENPPLPHMRQQLGFRFRGK